MGGAVLTAIKGTRGGGRSWFTRTTLRVTQKPAENSPFSQVGLIVRQWGTSSLHTLRQGKRKEKQMGFFEFVGPFQHLNCVFIIISDILFLVKSLLSTYVPGPSSCLSHVSYLNTENMFFQSSVFSTWAAVVFTSLQSCCHSYKWLCQAYYQSMRGGTKLFSGSNADFKVIQAHSLDLSTVWEPVWDEQNMAQVWSHTNFFGSSFLSHLLALMTKFLWISIISSVKRVQWCLSSRLGKIFHRVVKSKYHMKVPGTVMT